MSDLDGAAYEREERRHDEQAHSYAEYPDVCFVCEQQSKDDDE